MRTALGAAFALLVAGAAYAQAPGSDPYAAGVELRLAGRPADAVPHLEAATAATPRNADAWLQLGLAYAAVGRAADAERALDEALRLAPGYTDAEVARARLAWFRGDRAEARRRLEPVLAREPGHADALELKRSLDAPEAVTPAAAPAWRLDLSAARADLSKDLPAAQRQAAALSRRLPNGVAVGVSAERVRQFGQTDLFAETEVGTRHGYLALGGTPDADFRPEWSVRAGFYTPVQALGGGWTGQLALHGARARYPAGTVHALSPAVSLSRGGVTLGARWINLWDEQDQHRSGYAVQAAWRAAPKLELSAGWADAPETSEGVVADVRTASLGFAYDLSPRTTVRLGLAHEDRAAYDRREVTVGLTRRF